VLNCKKNLPRIVVDEWASEWGAAVAAVVDSNLVGPVRSISQSVSLTQTVTLAVAYTATPQSRSFCDRGPCSRRATLPPPSLSLSLLHPIYSSDRPRAHTAAATVGYRRRQLAYGRTDTLFPVRLTRAFSGRSAKLIRRQPLIVATGHTHRFFTITRCKKISLRLRPHLRQKLKQNCSMQQTGNWKLQLFLSHTWGRRLKSRTVRCFDDEPKLFQVLVQS